MRLLLFLTSAAAFAAGSSAATCESMASLQLANATVSAAETHPSGPFAAATGERVRVAAGFCRVAVTLKPTADSDIHIEIWLPLTGWNAKFQGVGNGGFAGSIGYDGLAEAVSRGYATASTDTGHRGDATNGEWALGHPEKITDFGYRAIHETAATAKLVIRAFYGSGPQNSYFNSCSNGGRQALMEAQRYPADYDGIVAGAPANSWTRLLTSGIFDMQALADAASYIPASKLPAIEAAALAACDARDGVKDGVIEDPSKCHFDPSVLLCKGSESAACLTAPQVAALRKLYAGAGAAFLPGYSPGGEAEGWAPWITGASPGKSLQSAFVLNFFRYFVYSDTAWDYRTPPLARGLQDANAKMGGVLNATETDLKPFRDRGGKLILYHGWSDAAIPPLATVNYYQSVVQNMGAANASGFVRLFMAPGVQHCFGGAGPNMFGQGGAPVADADHDVDAAVERWVEQGIAPDRIIATRFKSPNAAEAAIERTRPLCRYPATAHWTGKGDTNDAANFVCR